MQSDLVQGYTGARAGPAWIFSERNTWEKVESLIKLVGELLALFFGFITTVRAILCDSIFYRHNCKFCLIIPANNLMTSSQIFAK